MVASTWMGKETLITALDLAPDMLKLAKSRIHALGIYFIQYYNLILLFR